MNSISFEVYVNCLTYNHTRYLKDAFDGFCKQETKFPFVCGIFDDASTDGEKELIKEYLKDNFEYDDESNCCQEETDDYISVFAQHKINKNCFFVVFFLKYNHHQINKSKWQYSSKWRENAKYYATCEGDDFWIDSRKLQKQVDFMEMHPNHSLCFCAHRELYPSGETKDVFRYKENKEICPINDIILLGGDFMATNTMLYRLSMYIPYTTWAIDCPVGDLPLMLTLANNGNVGYINNLMSVYRKGSVGSWTQKMLTDFNKRREHHRAILRMWDQFDEFSNHRYHNLIVKKKMINKKNHCMDVILSVLSKLKNTIEFH